MYNLILVEINKLTRFLRSTTFAKEQKQTNYKWEYTKIMDDQQIKLQIQKDLKLI